MVLFKTIKKYPEDRYPKLLSKMVSHVQNTFVNGEDDLPCILCNEPTMNMVVLMPDERDHALGKVPKGKIRLVIFTICPTHDFNDSRVANEVDRALIRQWQ